ncbi:hypothetical protein ABT56_19080 [Photobacterium aquae]|uniref:Uncharacterized protein n=1 Tax=Photobacterium aquae TaxID=1195763 RepID=A0A0J1GUW8_9GAMM|nr:hypothetical protein [Photobacterium aquae]KLV03533.1 hypothetical protein ABT56_19080 [Photobacterium aquae]
METITVTHKASKPRGVKPKVFESDITLEWTDNDISLLREELIMYSLKQISDDRIPDKSESLNWLFDNSIHPFSSLVCFAEYNLDITIFRNFVLKYYC